MALTLDHMFKDKFLEWLRPYGMSKISTVMQRIQTIEQMSAEAVLKMFTAWCQDEKRNVDVILKRQVEEVIHTDFIQANSIAALWTTLLKSGDEGRIQVQLDMLESLIRMSGLCESTSGLIPSHLVQQIEEQKEKLAQKGVKNTKAAVFSNTIRQIMFGEGKDKSGGYFDKLAKIPYDPQVRKELLDNVKPLLRVTRNKNSKINEEFEKMLQQTMLEETTGSASSQDQTDDPATEAQRKQEKEEAEQFIQETKQMLNGAMDELSQKEDLQLQDVIGIFSSKMSQMPEKMTQSMKPEDKQMWSEMTEFMSKQDTLSSLQNVLQLPTQNKSSSPPPPMSEVLQNMMRTMGTGTSAATAAAAAKTIPPTPFSSPVPAADPKRLTKTQKKNRQHRLKEKLKTSHPVSVLEILPEESPDSIKEEQDLVTKTPPQSPPQQVTTSSSPPQKGKKKVEEKEAQVSSVLEELD